MATVRAYAEVPELEPLDKPRESRAAAAPARERRKGRRLPFQAVAAIWIGLLLCVVTATLSLESYRGALRLLRATAAESTRYIGESLSEKVARVLRPAQSALEILSRSHLSEAGDIGMRLRDLPDFLKLLAVNPGFDAAYVGYANGEFLLIRPLLRANKGRKRVAHIVIFFIFIVANCAGLLTPIGDPPLLLGFLRGVPFDWTLRLWPQWLAVKNDLGRSNPVPFESAANPKVYSPLTYAPEIAGCLLGILMDMARLKGLPYLEPGTAIRLGDNEFTLQKPCERCVLPSWDPNGANVRDKELHKHIITELDNHFGIYLRISDKATVKVGDAIATGY